MERAEKLQVTRTDFMASLNNDIKPVSICHVEQLYVFKSRMISEFRESYVVAEFVQRNHVILSLVRLLALTRKTIPVTS